MDPVTIIVGALVAGAAAGAKPAAEQAVKDAYNGLKALIQKRYATVNVGVLEEEPDSDIQKAAAEDTLKKKGAGQDLELLDEAKKVIDAVKQHDPKAAKAVGVNITDAEAKYIKIRKAVGGEVGVNMQGIKIVEGIDIDEAYGGVEEPKNPPER